MELNLVFLEKCHLKKRLLSLLFGSLKPIHVE